MSYFEDLSDYAYMAGEARPGLVHVGWLDGARAFPRGVVEEEILERLWRFCCGTVVRTRGLHSCPFCETWLVVRGEESLKQGTAEIRVFGKSGRAYAAPDMIYHYVVDHGYCPPAEFLDTVRECPLPGTSEYLELLKQWGMDAKGYLFNLFYRKQKADLKARGFLQESEIWPYRIQFSNGEEIRESVVTRPHGGSTLLVECSPVFVVGVVEGDVIGFGPRVPGYVMAIRGPNTACRVYFEENEVDEESLFAAAERAGGVIDGKAAFRGGVILVVTFPSLRADGGFKLFLGETRERYPKCRAFELGEASVERANPMEPSMMFFTKRR